MEKNAKLIGKGSFSKVYLIKEIKTDNMFSFEEEYTLVVLKKVDLLKLIKKYTAQKESKNMTINFKETIKSNQVTPFTKNNFLYRDETEEVETIEENTRIYYKHKLQELIQSEVDLLSNLYHRNIIHMLNYNIDIDEKTFEYNLKFEHMNCGDLYSILKNEFEPFDNYRNEFNGFNQQLTTYISKEIINGLKFLHDLNIIHRDIKLQNILIGNSNVFNPTKSLEINDFKIKISDFGFACIKTAINSTEDNIDDLPTICADSCIFPEFLTKSLQKKYYKLCGTPYYMAPEILLNISEDYSLNYNSKVDIWSFGLCLYELYFNILPLTNISSTKDIFEFYKHEYCQEFLNKKINNLINFDLKKILLKCLVVDKKIRSNTDTIHNLLHNCKDINNITNNGSDLKYNLNSLVNSLDNYWKDNANNQEMTLKKSSSYLVKTINNNLSWEEI